MCLIYKAKMISHINCRRDGFLWSSQGRFIIYNRQETFTVKVQLRFRLREEWLRVPPPGLRAEPTLVRPSSAQRHCGQTTEVAHIGLLYTETKKVRMFFLNLSLIPQLYYSLYILHPRRRSCFVWRLEL